MLLFRIWHNCELDAPSSNVLCGALVKVSGESMYAMWVRACGRARARLLAQEMVLFERVDVFFSFSFFPSTTNQTHKTSEWKTTHTVNPLKHTRKHHTCVYIHTYLSSRKNRIVIRVCYFSLSLTHCLPAWTFCMLFSVGLLCFAWLDGTQTHLISLLLSLSLSLSFSQFRYASILYVYACNKQKLKLWKFLDEKHHTSTMLTTIVVMMMMTTTTPPPPTTTTNGGDGTVFYVKSTRITSIEYNIYDYYGPWLTSRIHKVVCSPHIYRHVCMNSVNGT